MSDQYAVIGNPIAQSKSPIIHGMFAEATGQDGVYSKMEAPLDGFKVAVDAFRAAGGKGLNSTAPFKLDAWAYATESSLRMQLAGAANAMKFEGDQVLAENFDGVGLVRDVTHNLQCAMHVAAGGWRRGAWCPAAVFGAATAGAGDCQPHPAKGLRPDTEAVIAKLTVPLV